MSKEIGIFDSWQIFSDKGAAKETDKSVFEYNGSGIPKEIKWFFGAESLLEKEKKELTISYNLKDYGASISISNGRARIFWEPALGNLFKEFFAHVENYPILLFEKLDDDKYAVKFVEGTKPKENDSPKDLTINDLKVGEVYVRDDLIAAFGGSFMRGMNICKKTNTLVLISKHTKNRIYGDDWQNSLMVYTGEGQKGDQTLTAGNKKLYMSNEENTPVHLFVVFENGKYTYYGLVKLAGDIYYETENDVDGNPRQVIRFPLVRMNDMVLGVYESDGASIKPTHQVVGAAIVDNGKVLCAQRGYGDLEGKWEFPGGKIEGDETPQEALQREIKEELGVDVIVKEKIDNTFYEYEKSNVALSVYKCELVAGIPESHEHKALEWKSIKDIDELDWAEADDPIKDTLIDSLPMEIEEEIQFEYFESKPVKENDKEMRRSVQDYEKSQKKKQQAGENAEQAVIRYERDKLNNAGRPDLADMVRQVSKESSDFGYDVFSYELHDGVATEAHIEVKSAKQTGSYIEFFISQNELEKFKGDKAYKIYCLIRSGKKYKLHEVNKSEFRSDYLAPLTYRVRIRIAE